MANQEDVLRESADLLEKHNFREGYKSLFSLFQTSNKQNEIIEILEDVFVITEKMYQDNINVLKKYKLFWDKNALLSFDTIRYRVYPYSETEFLIYDRHKKIFKGKIDLETDKHIKYFFEDLSKPLLIENEINAYNLMFLFDKVRRSEDCAKDNHIYLYYDSFDILAIVMQILDVKNLLQDAKFVFLIGEKNRSKYPINFRKKLGIDYSKMKRQPLRLEEMNTFYLNKFYSYSGTDFFQGVLNGSDYILVVNNWFFYTSAKDIVSTYVEYLKQPEKVVDIEAFLKMLEDRKNDIKMSHFEHILPALKQVLSGYKTLQVHEVFKALFVAMMFVSERVEGKRYSDRITPIIFYDPHADFTTYYEVMRFFKYTKIVATIREPIMAAVRSYEALGTDVFMGMLPYTYTHSKGIPHWLTDKGFNVIRFEDLKTKAEPTLQAVCREFNIPYTEKLL